MLKSQGHMDTPSAPRILEINPSHPLIAKMSETVDKPTKQSYLKDMAFLLLDQARIIEGEAVTDPGAFSHRLNTFLEKGL